MSGKRRTYRGGAGHAVPTGVILRRRLDAFRAARPQLPQMAALISPSERRRQISAVRAVTFSTNELAVAVDHSTATTNRAIRSLAELAAILGPIREAERLKRRRIHTVTARKRLARQRA